MKPAGRMLLSRVATKMMLAVAGNCKKARSKSKCEQRKYFKVTDVLGGNDKITLIIFLSSSRTRKETAQTDSFLREN